MKERIVIKDEFWVKHFQEREKEFYEEDMCSGGNPEEWWHYEKEQVPENFSELKELCKKTGHYAINIIRSGFLDREYIFIFGLTFKQNGDIEDIENENIVEKRTPAQMWQIIKSLIGE